MIPAINDAFMQDFKEVEQPSKDFAMNAQNKIVGTVEELEEVKQAIYFILNTERYEHLIYSHDYGVEFKDLIGKSHHYVIPELERRITEALTQDSRIKSVTDFRFERQKSKLHVTFTVTSNFGSIESEVNVSV